MLSDAAFCTHARMASDRKEQELVQRRQTRWLRVGAERRGSGTLLAISVPAQTGGHSNARADYGDRGARHTKTRRKGCRHLFVVPCVGSIRSFGAAAPCAAPRRSMRPPTPWSGRLHHLPRWPRVAGPDKEPSQASVACEMAVSPMTIPAVVELHMVKSSPPRPSRRSTASMERQASL